MRRREFIVGGTATLGLLQAPKAEAVEGRDKKYIFVFAQGGWDPTRVFAPLFSNPNVDMEPLSAAQSAGGIRYVTNPERASVDSFFQSYHEKALICNGVQVRSISHEICTSIAMTGGTGGDSADWATILGAAQAERYAVPHLVVGGPSFVGPYSAVAVQTGSHAQLDELLTGAIKMRNDTALPSLPRTTEQLIDRYTQQRANARAAQAQYGADRTLSRAFQESTAAAIQLKEHRYTMQFTSGPTMSQQIDLCVDALSNDISRCVSMVHRGSNNLGWDSHADNDAVQSVLFADLFSSLSRLMAKLHSTRDRNGVLLSESCVLVVYSEMGRTAQLNATLGKDHWPYTSVLLWGEGLAADRAIGGFNSMYQGEPVDPASGAIDQSGSLLSIEAVGASLLRLGAVDPGSYLQDATPIEGILL